MSLIPCFFLKMCSIPYIKTPQERVSPAALNSKCTQRQKESAQIHMGNVEIFNGQFESHQAGLFDLERTTKTLLPKAESLDFQRSAAVHYGKEKLTGRYLEEGVSASKMQSDVAMILDVSYPRTKSEFDVVETLNLVFSHYSLKTLT